MYTCDLCRGKGWLWESGCKAVRAGDTYDCPRCKGTGKVAEKPKKIKLPPATHCTNCGSKLPHKCATCDNDPGGNGWDCYMYCDDCTNKQERAKYGRKT